MINGFLPIIALAACFTAVFSLAAIFFRRKRIGSASSNSKWVTQAVLEVTSPGGGHGHNGKHGGGVESDKVSEKFATNNYGVSNSSGCRGLNTNTNQAGGGGGESRKVEHHSSFVCGDDDGNEDASAAATLKKKKKRKKKKACPQEPPDSNANPELPPSNPLRSKPFTAFGVDGEYKLTES
jgi:hypothetical protein